MKKILLFLFYISFSVFTTLQAQVITRILPEESILETFLPWNAEDVPAIYDQPTINFDRILAQDVLSGITTPRFAVKLETDYTEKDGTWFDYGPFKVWKIGFSTLRCKSLNFSMNNVNLPEGSQLFVYGSQSKMLIGPVEPKHIFDKLYTTDIIRGTEAFIQVIVPSSKREEFSLTIDGISQGILKTSSGARNNFGGAGDCNYDVDCAIGSGWEDERDAVALVLLNSQFHCSGVLINNECQDLTPNFLTAFHCLDVLQKDGVLSAGEKSQVGNWVFRFKYESTTPVCPGNSTGSSGTWITYTGAQFRAAWHDSDFALLELNGNIGNQKNLALAGWDRNVNPTLSDVTCIHHPAGDSKKISIDNEPPIQVGNSPSFEWWFVDNWDFGSTQNGSSGSPLFSQGHKIIGQVHRGDTIPNCDPEKGTYFGRFASSWAGGATNDTRLSNWLGGTNPPLTTNTIRVPWVNTNSSDFLCTVNKAFTLENSIPGKTISWSVSPASLFATTSGAATSGTGIIATLRAANSSSSGQATLTYTISETGCSTATIVQDIWVGKPSTLSNPSGSSPISMGVGDRRTIFRAVLHSATSATWSDFGAVSLISSGNNFAIYEGDYAGTGNWQFAANNVCGTRNGSGQFNVSGSCNPCPKILVNNPVRDELYMEVPLEMIPSDLITNIHGEEGQFLLFNEMGKTVIQEKSRGKIHRTRVSQLDQGFYIAKLIIAQKEYTSKVVIIKR